MDRHKSIASERGAPGVRCLPRPHTSGDAASVCCAASSTRGASNHHTSVLHRPQVEWQTSAPCCGSGRAPRVLLAAAQTSQPQTLPDDRVARVQQQHQARRPAGSGRTHALGGVEDGVGEEEGGKEADRAHGQEEAPHRQPHVGQVQHNRDEAGQPAEGGGGGRLGALLGRQDGGARAIAASDRERYQCAACRYRRRLRHNCCLVRRCLLLPPQLSLSLVQRVDQEADAVDEDVDGDGAAAVVRPPPPQVVLRAQLHTRTRAKRVRCNASGGRHRRQRCSTVEKCPAAPRVRGPACPPSNVAPCRRRPTRQNGAGAALRRHPPARMCTRSTPRW